MTEIADLFSVKSENVRGEVEFVEQTKRGTQAAAGYLSNIR